MSLGLSYQGIRSTIPGTTSDAVSPIAGSLNADCGGVPISPEPLNIKKRRLPKMKPGKHLPRSTSTPQIREKAIMSDSDADKKRNKLGYQRISIACAHCRRRKIRCLVAEGDPQSRCQNCIRLKKECVFYPVDQQSAMENKHDVANKSGRPPGMIAASSLQAASGGFEQPIPFVSTPTLQSHTSSTFEGLPIDSGNALLTRGWPQGQVVSQRHPEHVPGGFSQPGYTYDAQHEDDSHWNPSGGYNPSQAHFAPASVESSAALYGRFNNPVANGDFAPFPMSETAQQNPHLAFANTPQPMRSATYGNIQGVPNAGHHYPMPAQQHSQIRYAPPPALNTQVASMLSHDMGPQSAPGQYSQAHPFMVQQDHGSAGSGSVSSHPAYGNWHPGLPPAEEQEYWRSQRPG